jgi:hypothetical protein
MKFLKYFSFLFLLTLMSCKNDSKLISELENIHATIKSEFAPDKRVELFDINFELADNQLILEGETTSKKAFSILGMSLKVLDQKGDFYRIQTPDMYISWVDRGGIQLLNKAEMDTWNQAKKVLFTKNFGYVFADKKDETTIISDITLGGILEYISEDDSFYEVKYPDNRTGFIKKEEAVIYDSWLENVVSSKENIEAVAKNFEGFPYLWGGTSSKGMDCSGFTKMVYLLNGLVIPRDASQQINAGKTVDATLKFEGLEKGDLLFFGTKVTSDKKQRVTHVGIWLGNDTMEFIHSSGNVHLSSMDASQPNYDEFNKNRYLGSKRYLGVKDALIIDLKEKMKL